MIGLNDKLLYNYVEWIAPHLSNQTFDIILISKAEHLDENRTFISDIYNEVKELDGNWSGPWRTIEARRLGSRRDHEPERRTGSRITHRTCGCSRRRDERTQRGAAEGN
jgi:hypothetical protein